MLSSTIREIKKLNIILNKNQKRIVVLVVVLALIAAMLETVGVAIIYPVIDLMLTPEKYFEYSWMQPIITLLSIKDNKKMIVVVITGVVLIFLLKNLYMVFFIWIKAKLSTKIHRELSVSMMESYMNRGYSYFLKKNGQEIIQGIANDTMSVYNILNLITTVIVKTLIVVMISMYMIYTDWVLALGVVLASLFCLIFIIKILKKPMKNNGILLRKYTVEANKVVNQVVYGIKEVIVMRKQTSMINQYKDKLFLRQKQEISRVIASETPNSFIETFCITSIMIVLCVRMLNYDDSVAFISVLGSFAMGAFKILPAVSAISGAFGSILGNKPGLDNVYDNTMEAKNSIDRFNNVRATDTIADNMIEFKKFINIRNVFFRYSNNMDYVLENLSVEIQKNTSVAFVGKSGAGKSTLVDVLLGIMPVEKGTITIDGINIKDIPNFWSKIIGFVPQAIYLFDESIAENVAFGEEKEKIDKEIVKKALEMANLLEFVDTLSDGMDTIVGDRGVRLSGGQRQRIGIARALYRNPEILILDEATSALDNETEQSVMEAIESLQGKMTLIIIAHRLTTIRKCDKIFEIVDGNAIERKYEDIV